MIGNCIIAQSGGPTSAINASVYGAVMEAFNHSEIKEIYGAQNGIIGIFNQDFFDLRKESLEQLELLKTSPASAFGSCRYKIKHDEDLEKVFNIFKLHNIRYFFYAGGNDSMDTADKIHKYSKKIGYDIKVLGLAKTIDNDLAETDHCPGYGSAAKYIATSVLEVAKDAEIYQQNIITVIEVMGRNAGWLAAAAALSNQSSNVGADLIYLPERAFSTDSFLKDVKKIYDKKGKVIVVVSEGIKDSNGTYISELYNNTHKDVFGHSQLGGVGSILGSVIRENIEKRVKVLEFGILQRCAMHFASNTDIEESVLAGSTAVKCAIEGQSGYMVGFDRNYDENGTYHCSTKLIPLSSAANAEKIFPAEWINEEGNYVTQDAINYIKPLIVGEVPIKTNSGLPVYAELKKCFIEKKI